MQGVKGEEGKKKYRFGKETGRKGEERGAVSSELCFHGIDPYLLSIYFTQCTGPDAEVGLSYSHTGSALHNPWGAIARDNIGGSAEEAGWLHQDVGVCSNVAQESSNILES